MSAQIIADWLCALGKDVHLLLRDVQRDADHDPRFISMERRLASLLQDVDRAAELAERDAIEECILLDDVGREMDRSLPTGIPRDTGQQLDGAA